MSFCRSFVLFLSIIFILSTGNNCRATTVLAADSVEVRQNDKNSLIAKEKALSTALSKSFYRLLKDRLEVSVPPHSVFSTKEINDCVYDYSIENEKRSSSIYICEVIYRFDEEKIISLLDKHNISHSNVNSKSKAPLLRIAVYIEDYISKLSNSDFFKTNLIVEKFLSTIVVVKIKNCTLEKFKELGIKYGEL